MIQTPPLEHLFYLLKYTIVHMFLQVSPQTFLPITVKRRFLIPDPCQLSRNVFFIIYISLLVSFPLPHSRTLQLAAHYTLLFP